MTRSSRLRLPPPPARWSYEEAVRHILSFINYEAAGAGRLPPRTATDLERFQRALGRLGHPERQAPSLHVVGTNGKGSTAAMLRALLSARGVRTGLYTSPHLVEMLERVQIDGRALGRAAFARAARRAAEVVEAAPGSGFRTTFEILTALAFAAFQEAKVGAMVIEAGMGGRLDATNVLDPRVVVVTSISLDHTEVLGGTVADIASDKAGVFRRGVPVVSAPQAPAAVRALERRAARQSAPIEFVGREIVVEGSSFRGGRERVTIRTPLARYADLPLALIGPHQAVNAALALRAAELFAGGPLDPGPAAAALGSVRWPARFQIVSRRPLLILDGAHNPGGAEALAAAIGQRVPGRPVHFVLGLTEGKDVEGLLRPLLALSAGTWITAAGHPRAAAPARLVPLARTLTRGPVQAAPGLDRALRQARAAAGPGGVVVVAGSLYLAGDLLRLWPELRAGWSGTSTAGRRPGREKGRPAGRPRRSRSNRPVKAD